MRKPPVCEAKGNHNLQPPRYVQIYPGFLELGGDFNPLKLPIKLADSA